MMYRDNNKSLQMPSGSAPPVPKQLKGKPLPRIYTHRHFTLFYNDDQIIEAYGDPSNNKILKKQYIWTPTVDR